jgi:hypothetical protein
MRRVKPNSHHLRLFRVGGIDPKNPQYRGSLLVPGEPPTFWNVQAAVSDYTAPDGTVRKCMVGWINGGQDVRDPAERKKLKGKVEPDLFAVVEDFPFDDPLPEQPF